MKKIYGKVYDYDGNPLENADVIIKDKEFNDIQQCKTNELGYYEMLIDQEYIETLGIFKDYPIDYLEYWAWKIPVKEDLEINAKIGGIEIYGMNSFIIQGAYPAITIYFRPMSLKRFKEYENNSDLHLNPNIEISPMISKDTINAYVNEHRVEVLKINKIEEYVSAHQTMNAYIIQVEIPSNYHSMIENKITIEIHDIETNEMGMGSIWI